MTKLNRDDLERMTRAFTETFNDNDLDAMMSYFAEEGAVYDQHDGAVAEGLEAIRAAFDPQFAGDYGVMRFEAEDLIVDPDQGKTMIRWLCTFDSKRFRTRERP